FPDADFKVYLEANPEERALRRLLERGARSEAGLVQTLREIQERDRLDSTRAAAPLQRPADALVIDTDEVPPDRVVQRILEVFEGPLRRLARWYGAFPVRRGQADRQAIRTALDYLANGSCVGMFPEGTRSQTGGLIRGHIGAGLIAVRSGAQTLPVAIAGTG